MRRPCTFDLLVELVAKQPEPFRQECIDALNEEMHRDRSNDLIIIAARNTGKNAARYLNTLLERCLNEEKK